MLLGIPSGLGVCGPPHPNSYVEISSYDVALLGSIIIDKSSIIVSSGHDCPISGCPKSKSSFTVTKPKDS